MIFVVCRVWKAKKMNFVDPGILHIESSYSKGKVDICLGPLILRDS